MDVRTTLLLDRSFVPIGIISRNKAITLFYSNKAEVLETYEEYVKSPSVSIKVPAVMRLINWFKRKTILPRFTRKAVAFRDNYKCGYCDKTLKPNEVTIDHIVPSSRGGATTWDNVICCCKACNSKKGDRTLKESGMALKHKPGFPNHLHNIAKEFGYISNPVEWYNYIEFLRK